MFPCEDSKTVSVPEKRNHHSFVNISPTLVIDASMERSSRVLQHGNPKIWFFFQKVRNSNFDFWRRAEITLTSSYQSYIGNWYINGKVFTSTTAWKPKNVKFFQKVRNWQNWILSVPRVSVCRETKLPWLRQYQSYISNWYVNGKVFTSTTTWEPINLIFFSKKFEIEFDLYFDLCWRAEINIQVGRNMHLYVDIGDTSSSLWGSTSSWQ